MSRIRWNDHPTDPRLTAGRGEDGTAWLSLRAHPGGHETGKARLRATAIDHRVHAGEVFVSSQWLEGEVHVMFDSLNVSGKKLAHKHLHLTIPNLVARAPNVEPATTA